MSATTTPTADLIDSLDPEQIRAELADLDARREALRVLLRAAIARQRGRVGREAGGEEVAHAS
jgi:hypothetical protein